MEVVHPAAHHVALQSAIADSLAPVYYKDARHVYIACSKSYAKLMGCHVPEDLLGLRDRDLMEQGVDFFGLPDAPMVNGRTLQLSQVEVRQGLTKRYFDVKKYFLEDLHWICCQAIDVTENHFLREKLQAMMLGTECSVMNGVRKSEYKSSKVSDCGA